MVRNHYLVRSLLQRHTVWASFCGADGGEQFAGELPLRREGLPALFDPAVLLRAYKLIRRENIQHIISGSLISGLHGVLLKLLTGRPFWLDDHNVEWHCSRRYGHRFWWLIYLLEGFIVLFADQVTCVSEDDRARLIRSYRLSPKKVTVAPNGVDYPRLIESAPASHQARSHKRVLFFGVLDYPPNHQAVKILGEQIAPHLADDVEILVAGRGGEDLVPLYPQLKFLGFVDDIHSLIKDCDGLVVPLMAGGGTRLKILETLACGVPVVSTTLGAEGIELSVTGEALTILDSPYDMVDWIENLETGAKVELPEEFAGLYDWSMIWQNRAPL